MSLVYLDKLDKHINESLSVLFLVNCILLLLRMKILKIILKSALFVKFCFVIPPFIFDYD